MHSVTPDSAGMMFKKPKQFLGDLEAEATARVISAAADVALVLDKKGVIRDVAFGSEEMSQEGYGSWLGQPWVETVTVESRDKVRELLLEASAESVSRWRQVNHPSSRGVDVPVRYSALQIGQAGRVVAVGRDLRSVAVLQQQLVEAQQAMEREYARLRQAETRYRLLFQIASEPVLIVDAETEKLVDANPAAATLFDGAANQRIAAALSGTIDSAGVRAIEAQIDLVRTAGRADDVAVSSKDGSKDFHVSASLFRQDRSSHILLRVAGDGAANSTGQGDQSNVLKVVEKLPDGFVVTDADRRIVMANAAFLDLVQVGGKDHARGVQLSKWLGRTEVDLNVLIANVREHGSVSRFGTILRTEYGAVEEVEVSAVSVPSDTKPCYGFSIRAVGLRLTGQPISERQLPHSVDQLTELVGRVPLKNLVRDTTDIIERLCIEAALELTGDNRASAAEMLGLSRQSLYDKLNRYGLSESEQNGSGDTP